MGNLIDRDAAHDAIGFERCDRSCTDCPTKCTWFYTVKNIPAVNRLIPCGERLPEKSGLYLTYQKELGRFQLMRYSPVLRNGTGWFDDNYGLYVTHWMPLPEPPEKE